MHKCQLCSLLLCGFLWFQGCSFMLFLITILCSSNSVWWRQSMIPWLPSGVFTHTSYWNLTLFAWTRLTPPPPHTPYNHLIFRFSQPFNVKSQVCINCCIYDYVYLSYVSPLSVLQSVHLDKMVLSQIRHGLKLFRQVSIETCLILC